MKISKFSLYRDHAISCKLFTPDDGKAERIIVGVHGFAGDKDSSMLYKLAEETAGFGTALVCFDFPAHGESEADERYLTAENCKNDLLAVTSWAKDNYPAADKVIFATSFGGYISLLCAKELEGFTYILRAPAVTMPKVLLDAVLKISPEKFKSLGTVECGFERKINLPYEFYEGLLRYDPMNAPYSQKMLIIHGDLDDVVPYGDIKDFCGKHPDVRLTTVKGADHRFKNPGESDIIIGAVKDFLLA